MEVKKPIKLNIGCGRSSLPREEGWVNCDLYPGDGVDIVFDAQERWPFSDESIAHIGSSHTLEHLNRPLDFFREAWRVLIPNGLMTLRVPHGGHRSSMWDLTHIRPWFQESFAILQPGFTHFTRNFQHENMGFAFWVHQVILIFSPGWGRAWRFKPLRPFIKWAGGHLTNVYFTMIIDIFKTTAEDRQSVAFGGSRHPCSVPCNYGVYKHHYYGQSGDGLIYHELLVFTDAKKAIAGFA